MKKRYSLSKTFFTFLACAAYSTSHAQLIEYLNANEVNAGISAGGNIFSQLDTFGGDSLRFHLYEVPKGTNKRDVFAAALWMTGYDTLGITHCAGQTFGQRGHDYYDGPIVAVYDSTYDNYYRRVFKITRTQVNQFRALSFPTTISSVDAHILNWPGKGNAYVVSNFGVNINSNLAPFIDVDGDGIYNPLNGDYPAFCCEEAVFFVFNDMRGYHYETQTPDVFGVEIRGLASECVDTTSLNLPFTKRAVNNTVFVQYEIENKSTSRYNDYHLAMFEDPDIGCAFNDRVGCDTVRNLMFAYNGSAPDLSCDANTSGYQPYQAAQCVAMLNQTVNSFVYFTNGSPPATSDPSNCGQFNNYLHALWADGTLFKEGGRGYGGTVPANFMFPGDPNDSTSWSEVSPVINLPADDRRMVGTIASSTFLPGEIKHFDFAFTTSYDSTASLLGIVDTLKHDADIVQQFYNNNLRGCINSLTGISKILPNDELEVSIYPNPAKQLVFIESPVNLQWIELESILGQTLLHRVLSEKKTALDVSGLAKGVYMVKISGGGKVVVKKVLVE